jgi:hypothetical protein
MDPLLLLRPGRARPVAAPMAIRAAVPWGGIGLRNGERLIIDCINLTGQQAPEDLGCGHIRRGLEFAPIRDLRSIAEAM